MRKRLLLVALIVLAAGCGGDGGGNGSSAPPATQSGGVEQIDAAMQDVMRRYSPPGIAVAVVRQGKLVFADAYGSADLGPGGGEDAGSNYGRIGRTGGSCR